MRIAETSACAMLIVIGACAVPGASEPEGDVVGASDEVAADEMALYRIGDGDNLSAIADQLSFPGGWRALARANHLRGDRIRAGAALRVPVGYLRAAGLDPYADFGLERFPQPIASEPLVACRDEVARGACATLGDVRLCVEPTEASALADPDSDDDCAIAADGAIDCASQPGRELVVYRGGAAAARITLPQRGDLSVEAHRVDLDGDGRPELVAAIPIELRNHEGWQSVRAVVLDDRGDPAVSFDVAQWGEGSLIEAADSGCDVLATSWEWVRHPLEGEAVYFVGRRLAWRDGGLEPRDGEAMRRFRTYFHVTCAECDDLGPQTPAAWLSGAETSWWPELGDGTPVRDRARGTIVGVAQVHGAVVFDVDLAGRRVRLDPNAIEYDETRPRDVLPVAWLRLGPTGATLPDMFVPAAPEGWIGRPAMLIEVGTDDGGAPMRALWIDPPAPRRPLGS
jgi:hypothetical protein